MKKEIPHIDDTQIDTLSGWMERFGIIINKKSKSLDSEILLDLIELKDLIKKTDYSFRNEESKEFWNSVISLKNSRN